MSVEYQQLIDKDQWEVMRSGLKSTNKEDLELILSIAEGMYTYEKYHAIAKLLRKARGYHRLNSRHDLKDIIDGELYILSKRYRNDRR